MEPVPNYKTKGISPKVIADLAVSLVTFVVTYYGIELDPEVSAVIAKALGTLAAVAAGPGNVERS